MIGIPNLISVYRAGNVAIINAPGNGVADDKGIYYFVPKMIEYYLHQKAILKNAPTYLPYYPEDQKYILENIDKLVIKDVAEAGGYGVIFGKDLKGDKLDELIERIEKHIRKYYAKEDQMLISFLIGGSIHLMMKSKNKNEDVERFLVEVITKIV